MRFYMIRIQLAYPPDKSESVTVGQFDFKLIGLNRIVYERAHGVYRATAVLSLTS